MSKAVWDFPDANAKAFLWLDPDTLEDSAKQQIFNLMELPFAKHLAVMPDCHSGYGMPIGGVLATDNVVIPNAVGVDIGCGMIAAKFVFTGDIRQYRADIRAEILKRVPVGFKWHQKPWGHDYMPKLMQGMVLKKQYERARKQLGTLGGGNHFIEVQVDQHDNVWVMIHSGSRNLGKQICDYYNEWARDDNRMHFSQVSPDKDLAFFHRDHNGFDEYVTEMQYAIEFAKSNRAVMMRLVMQAFQTIWPNTVIPGGQCHDICHNQMTIEHHFGKNLYIHRKGAAGPYRGDRIGIIPGNMGAKSYLVQHTGEVTSMLTTSHGAGRVMSRAKAKKTLDLAEEQRKLDEIGVLHGLKTKNSLDEAPSSYKDIDEVMARQQDLVKVVTELTPVISVKDES